MGLARRLAPLVVGHFLMAIGNRFITLFLILHLAGAREYSSLGIVLAVRAVPTMLVAGLGGVLADRYDRKLIAMICSASSAVLHLMMVICVLRGLMAAGYLLSFAAGVCTSLGSPALYALVPAVAGRGSEFRANALVRTARNGGNLLAPALVLIPGTILEQSRPYLGPAVVLASAAVVGMARPHGAKSAQPPQTRTRDDGRRGLASLLALLSNYRILACMIGFWSIYLPLQEGVESVVMPSVIASTLGTTQWAGLALATTLGYLAASVAATASSGFFEGKPHLMEWSAVVVLAAAAPSVTANLWPAMGPLSAACFISGAALELSGVMWAAGMQKSVAEEHLGRVSSIDYAASFGLVPVGLSCAGLAIEVWGTESVLRAGAMLLALLPLAALMAVAALRAGRGGAAGVRPPKTS